MIFSIFTHPLPSPYTHISIPLITKLKLPILSRLKSTFATTELIPITEAHNLLALQEQTHSKFSPDKLFIPPDTEVSVNENSSGLRARVLKGSNIVLSKYARDAQVFQAEFIKSSVRTEDCPSDGLPEFALVGRSNVGKSSLLNSIVRRNKLALTSKKPGKTQCINHFKVNDSWYLVDLPGFGYASAPRELRTDWNKFTKNYFLNRSTLVSVFLLIDASIPAKKIDLEYASWLGQNQVPMTLIFTKCDKRKKKNGGKRPEENVNAFQELIRDFFETAPPWIMTSGVTNQGRDEMLLHIAQLRNYWLKH
ncbi:PROTEIN putative EXPRESSED-RELATED [Salix viminalis]|uniref:PROTEIN putative EXPRESSED-RELATED n=1 Tax=Salix viminalis TaxID=40686 RepID=A0A9Q0NQI9_SALVM|nr:PROTEIN putative EXPRESSED-RELATED [Salix viminalis]KAJ6674092.1 PROTEIN putative EXPRESSED-RELATED [Salix viminalis]